MRLFSILCASAVLVLAAYIRLAPSDPARWHVEPPMEAKEMAGGVVVIISGDAALLDEIHEIAVTTPRTKILAGSVGEGHVTYVTRSLIWGFPDYTTLALNKGKITLFARLRFGRSDLGVNGTRVQNWLKSAQAAQ